ncbi:MAG: hypothetical protein ACOYMF_05170 [Bacteroidales bacterium]
MSFDQRFINYGVIKIEGKNVKLYKDSTTYSTININEEVSNAVWAGSFLNVSLKNGKVRRYSDTTTYQTI